MTDTVPRDTAPLETARRVSVPSTSSPAAAVLVRPHHFAVNPDTAKDNAFQSRDEHDARAIATAAYEETSALAEALVERGVTVHLFDDERDDRPDAIFPNNWFTTHADGRIALYPMRSPLRRSERRTDIVDALSQLYRVEDVVDYSPFEAREVFLEGTGALVLDREQRVAYVARSPRAHDELVERFCADFDYEPVVFDAVDEHGTPIYHTNVMMSVGTETAIIVADTIPDDGTRARLLERLRDSGRTVVELDFPQLHDFAANAIELTGSSGPLVAMSERARDCLTDEQVALLESRAELVVVPVPTAELSGGSVRCMIAGVHLPAP